MNDVAMTVFVFVNYRDYSMLEDLLKHQLPITGDYRVVVVDNTEPDRRNLHALRCLEKTYGIETLMTGNLGYLGAVRYAVDQLPEIREADFLLVCNTDLEFDFAKVCQHLQEKTYLLRNQNVGVIAPRLVSIDGSPAMQRHLISAPSAQSMRCLSRIFSNYFLLVLHKRLGDLKRRLIGPQSDSAESLHDGQEIFAPHGALMVFSQDYIQTNGAFDFPCFLYGEEIFVGLQAKRHNLKCIYDDALTYSHKAHGSMGSWPSRTVANHLSDAHTWAAEALTKMEKEAQSTSKTGV